MKQTELIALGLAAVAVYLIAKSKGVQGVASAPRTTTGTTFDKVTEILDSAGKAFSNGWRYFSNGTSIDPKGNYYKGNQLVWQNPANFV